MKINVLFQGVLFHFLLMKSSAFSVESKGLSKGVKLSKLLSSFSDEYIEIQKEISDRSSSDLTAKKGNIDEHLSHQEKVFDELADFFNSDRASAPGIEIVLDYIIEKTLRQMMESRKSPENTYCLIDVGSGTGALFTHYLRMADKLGIKLHITAVDLSENMTKYGQENADDFLSAYKNDHSIQCISGDFVELITGQNKCVSDITGFSSGIMNDLTGKFRRKYDAVVINSCYGNFFDSDSLINAGAIALKSCGILVMSHPLGSQFVKDLNQNSPDTVPNILPNPEVLHEMIKRHGFCLKDFIDGSVDIGDARKLVFYASIEKLPFRLLRSSVRLRGRVDSGYGRGGKKLGFPTANLPSSLFANALSTLPTGVYIGYALIEGEGSGCNKVHKAVVNIGYSPTFQGEENKEKIVEAHLIVNDGEFKRDFYGEMMRLALYGFLRPEIKFSSFPDLVTAITNDVATAKFCLGLDQFCKIKVGDSFFRDLGTLWIGSSGGNEEASFEFKVMDVEFKF